MKTLDELQEEMSSIASQLNVPLPKYNNSVTIPTKDSKPSWGVWYEMGDGEYLEYVPKERAAGHHINAIEDENEFLFQLTTRLINRLARDWEKERRVRNVDSRRLMFAREIELFGLVNPEWQQRAAESIKTTLARAPYRDKTPARLKLNESFNWIDTQALCPFCGKLKTIRSQMNLASSIYGDDSGNFTAREYTVGDVMGWFKKEHRYYEALWQADAAVGTGTEECYAECMSCGADLRSVIALKDFEITEVADIVIECSEKIDKKQEEKNRAYLEINKNKAGVEVTDSGLQIEVLRSGAGVKPTRSSRITFHYVGTDLNGDEFDNSYKRGDPVSGIVNVLAWGLIDGILRMNAGAKYRFVLPAKFANVDTSTHTRELKPDSVLIYEIELLKIEQ